MALINMPAEPQLWDNEKLQEDNTAYQLECEAAEEEWKTETMQEWTNKLLYWKKVESISKNELISSVKLEHPELKDESFIPFLEWMCYSWELTVEQYDVLLWNYIEKWEFYFDWLDFSVAQEQSIIDKIDQLKHAKNPENQWWIEDFYTDIPDIKQSLENWEVSLIEEEVLSIVGRHYIWLNENKTPEQIKLNQSVAIEASCEDMLKEAKNLRKDTVAFDRCMADIKGNNDTKNINIDRKMEWLLSLYTQIWTAEWSVWAKWSKNFKAMQQWREKRKEALKQQYEETITAINNNHDDTQQQDLVNEQEMIVAEAKEIENWEVFNVWELDVYWEWNIWEWNDVK